MKPVILSALMLACIAFGVAMVPVCEWLDRNFSPPPRVPVPVAQAGAGRITFDDLLDAIEWVESKGDPSAVGKDGELGSFQIKKIYVDDVNRIIWRGGEYSYGDRKNRHLSREMVKIYLGWYATRSKIGRRVTLEDFVRIHNGGPQGHKKECTKPYWEKVKARMELMTKAAHERACGDQYARATWPEAR